MSVWAGLLVVLLASDQVAAQLLPLPAPKPAVTCAPSTTSQSGTLFVYACTGATIGVEGEVAVTVAFTAGAETICTNRYDPSLAVPGRVGVYVGGSQSVFASKRKLPSVSGMFAIAGPAARGAGCPSDDWIVTLGPVAWTARYSVQRLSGEPPVISFGF